MTLNTTATCTVHLKVVEILDGIGRPQPCNGPAVEAYGDTLQDALDAGQKLLITNSHWVSAQVIALEKRGELSTPMGWMNWIIELPADLRLDSERE